MNFSIIVPTYNRKKLLIKCLNSLINQDYPKQDYAIIVVNDGSTDNTENVIESLKKKNPNIIYIKIKHSGQGAARNAGLRRAEGKFIAFTDDDCVVESNWLKKIDENFKKYDADAVGGSIINPTNRYIAWSQYILNFSSWFPKGKKIFVKDIPTNNIAYKKSAIKGYFFPELQSNMVYEDTLYNFSLYKNNKKILFCPGIRVKHYTWNEGYGLKKFFGIQKKAAIGFALGGYEVHGKTGRILMNFRFLNLLAPRLIMVFLRCIRQGYFLRFALCFPLILLGEVYRGIVIFSMNSHYSKERFIGTLNSKKS